MRANDKGHSRDTVAHCSSISKSVLSAADEDEDELEVVVDGSDEGGEALTTMERISRKDRTRICSTTKI